ncbi:hypothetical protein R6258_04780 [Halomonas sp. HP20-15]|uniref:hypothetical protein n=1 Tax=Halomonas sp. HP20-15 TaxID=3085901 RepID=UPI0029811F4A|nr:hypothetical protein [Halomonas sp. HP20-15]MDW5376228.1 hypothetical protein [Halomonas sp. HP20-15]
MADDDERAGWPDWQRWLERLHYQAWQLNGGCLRGAHVTSNRRDEAELAARRRAALGLYGWRRG